MFNKVYQILPKAETVFKICYLLLVMLSFNSLVAGNAVLSVLNYALVAFGALLLLFRAFHFKQYINSGSAVLLILFCVSMAVSALLNRKYGIVENVQALAWTTLQFGMLYLCDKKRPAAEYKREFVILASVFSVYVLLANLVSIAMFFAHYGVFGQYSFNGNIIGFIWGRLWGVYSDPNNGSVMCVASIVLCICAWMAIPAKTKKAFKAFLCVNIILDYCYIILSDSRTGMVCALIGVACVLFFGLSAKFFRKKELKPVLKNCLCLVLAVVISVTLYSALQLMKSGYNYTIEKIMAMRADDPTFNEDNLNAALITGRDSADTESDISNRRFDLWKSGLEIWKTSPIFGVSQRNITPYAKDVVPDTYLVNNDMGDFDSTHNMFIDVLVSQGAVGILLLLAFFVCMAVLIIRRFLCVEKHRTSMYHIALFSVLVVFACSCMFVLDVLYLNSAATVMFWSSLGYFVHSLRENKA